MDYNVFFEIGGKKLCQKVTAESEPQAIQKVRDDINFIKIKKVKPKPDYKLPMDKDVQDLMDQLGIRT